jgi:hypothetical protein
MTDDELRAEINKSVEQHIPDNPEVALATANNLGWTVIPPAIFLENLWD